ncbi:hypothetical protein [Burkholderia ubonensis]|uniref:hypothetical protein n=1 Tax=Burkholderia ubonensis TaxID=101571 RepID=UPI0007523149|nr:hypothetical protein [Burkholderia ubonensis]KVP17007.1 hypothetical protein WJ84_01665 [Burkholderia ubonensis]
MRFRFVSAALALFAVAGVAQADIVGWDGVAEVPAIADSPGSYLVCAPDMHFDTSRGAVDKSVCSKGAFGWDVAGSPKAMTLQQALDLHFKAPAGTRAMAVGPLPVYNSDGRIDGWLHVAYRLVKE